MKPIYQKLTAAPEEGFVFKEICAAGFDCPWHVHPEFELILVLKSNGYRIVGDNISSLAAGDLVFVGPGLPHIWQNEPASETKAFVHVLLVQFEAKFLGDDLLALPAFRPVQQLFGRARRGLHVLGRTRDEVGELMKEMSRLSGLDRLIQFLRILAVLARSTDCGPLASSSFETDVRPYDQERMDRVLQFLNRQLGQTVRLSEAARVASLSDGAFSRFFHAHTGKTFPDFVNELRIGRACRLLLETDKTITEVAFECGFDSLTNFNRQFRRLKSGSPRDFRNIIQERLAHPSRAGIVPR
jgi:AraC-like DNA-binding protein